MDKTRNKESRIVIVSNKLELDEPPKQRMCIDFQKLNVLQPTVVKLDSKAKVNLTLHPLPKIDELYTKLVVQRFFQCWILLVSIIISS